ncbi:MAG: glutamine--tRNA ligase/YqeY domain fusion protein [bacterium]|nr:glutamine--tRNA ligase [Deltaproteobacteria bacterium]MCP4908690.1 glutamine--tRNA ligase/YqeY domain fusion protein [bacterium]
MRADDQTESGSGGEAGAQTSGLDFIRTIVAEDIASGKHDRVVTRFPPEPNGYLHVGHAKAICLDFGLASEVPDSRCHLRFDDTNPSTEDTEYVDGIQEDVRWLGFDWKDHLHFTSDYFEELFGYAVDLIEQGKAFVDDQSAEEIRANQGTLTEPGTESPDRNRNIEENLDLFTRMRAGEFADGECVLRAKIDMAAPVVAMRDPILYRIQKKTHHRTGDRWCVYPMYDFAHCLSDALELITHSLCTLEFLDHRPLYDWILDQLETPSRPRQIEFARLNVSHTITSKRALRRVVEEGHVRGWDDPRMPTIAAMRRRGYPARAIREFCEAVGVAKRDNLIELSNLEFHVRQVLNLESPRRMGVLRPLKIVIENYPADPEDREEFLDAINNPEDASAGSRKVPFGREIYIERDDFMEDPPKKFFRLSPGREVRLRYAYFITCQDVIKDEAGEIVELRCTYDPATRGGDAPDGRKVKGTLHWVSARHAVEAEVRHYETLFKEEEPDPSGEGGLERGLSPDSLEVLETARLEPACSNLVAGDKIQLERLGYYCLDIESHPGRPVLNRTATLRDTWAKVAKQAGGTKGGAGKSGHNSKKNKKRSKDEGTN